MFDFLPVFSEYRVRAYRMPSHQLVQDTYTTGCLAIRPSQMPRHKSILDAYSHQSVPDAYSHQSVPDAFSHQSVPDAYSHQSVPDA